MNQEPGDCGATYPGLQGFAVVGVERVQHPQRGPVKIVRIERRNGQHECPEGGRRQASRLFAGRSRSGCGTVRSGTWRPWGGADADRSLQRDASGAVAVRGTGVPHDVAVFRSARRALDEQPGYLGAARPPGTCADRHARSTRTSFTHTR
jgi:hypothetical protein